MNRLRIASVVVALVLLVGLVAACRIAGKQHPYLAIGANGETLRVAFNADAGRVRVLLLVAPT